MIYLSVIKINIKYIIPNKKLVLFNKIEKRREKIGFNKVNRYFCCYINFYKIK